MSFNQKLTDFLMSFDKYISTDNELLRDKVIKDASTYEKDLINALIADEEFSTEFFISLDDNIKIFKSDYFCDYLKDKNFLDNSYTKFQNKITFNIKADIEKEVVLVWPYKDCILEGGQSKDEENRQEIFFNITLAKDEITKLLEPKVLTNFQKWTKDGQIDFTGFTRDTEINEKRGLSKDTITDNLLIKGNNLLALHSIKKEFKGKVKCIYIDPPYNKGDDSFQYNDRFTHSTWLTFMKNRLEIAKSLLKDDGIIFVQCDDMEQAYLKVLMDDIFERKNFLINFIWQRKGTSTNVKNVQVSQLCDMIICYQNKEQGIYPKITKTEDRKYPHYDDILDSNYRVTGIEKKNTGQYKRETMTFKILGQEPREGKRWQMGFKKAEKLEKEGRFFIEEGIVKQKIYDFEDTDSLSARPSLLKSYGSTDDGNKQLQALNLGIEFDNPKPEELMEHIIEISSKRDDIIMDFHVGSGTTSAVAHKMERQYIGIEQMDYIEELTKERLKKVIEGELGGISESIGWTGDGSFVYFELHEYNQIYVDKLQGAEGENDLLQIYDEMKENAFFNYNVDMKAIGESREDFEKLEFDELQKLLLNFLNYNMLYQPLSSLEDDSFNLSKSDIGHNKDFYKIKENG